MVAAVRDGRLDEAVVDVAARRVLHLVARSLPALDAPGAYDGADLGSGTDEAALRAEAVDVVRAAGTLCS